MIKTQTKRIKRRLGKTWAWVLAGGILAILAFPHLVSAYHLEAGGRALDNSERLAYHPLLALAHLQKALEWSPDNAQAYRLLAKVYQVQGEELMAAEALARYTELRPDNPLGHIELAQVYESIEAEMQRMQRIDLLAALPGAAVEAPDVPADTPYAEPDGPAWHSYVAATTFSLAPNFGARPTLFMHPPARVYYPLTLPPEAAVLRFGLGLAPETMNWPGDGATFEVLINGQSVFQEHLDKEHARQGWQERTVDLSPWAGQDIVLSVGIGPGPAGDVSGDWAGWGEPQVVDARLPELESLHPGAQAVEEWKRAGLTAEDFIEYGEVARKAKQYDEATEWYERAMRLEPGLGDPWYYVGLLYESQEQWPQALAAYERAVASARFEQVGRSSPHYRTGIIYQRRLEPRQPESALAAYEAALGVDSFSSTAEAAACHYRRGDILRGQKADPDKYIDAFRQAIELNPKHVWAHVRLGQAYYIRDQDAIAAEAEILKGLELAPQNKWIYVVLGDLYRQENRMSEAEAMYEQSLEITPGFEAARDRLEALEGK